MSTPPSMGSGSGGRTGAFLTGLTGGGFSMAAMATLLSSRPVTNGPILAPGLPARHCPAERVPKGVRGHSDWPVDSGAIVRGSTNGSSVILDWFIPIG